jgi:NAD(P)-dependent dehydrogenase (short-subunit alcohol dehydrogenase family)
MSEVAGRRYLVTGATSGIGRETAQALAAMGGAVVVHGRDAAAVDSVCRSIVASTHNERVTGIVADFASLADVRRMAGDLASGYPSIDVLVNNAGAMTMARRTTADGFEWQFGVNHLAPFLLTNLLLDKLTKADAARIVNVASHAHRGAAPLDFDDLQSERGKYRGFRAYSASKLANILFTLELSRRLAGTNATANSLHPGAVATNIFRTPGALGKIGMRLARMLLLPPAKGAVTSVYLATSPDVAGVTGKYFAKCRPVAPSPAAADAAAAARLWDVSERLTA